MSREGAGRAPGAGAGREPELRSRRVGAAAVPGQQRASAAVGWRVGPRSAGEMAEVLGRLARLSRPTVSPTAVGCLWKYVFPPVCENFTFSCERISAGY